MVPAMAYRYSTGVLIALGAGLVISVVAFILAYRQAKRAPFFLWRHEAAKRARWCLGVSVLLFIALGGMAWWVWSQPAPPEVSQVAREPSATSAGTEIIPEVSPTPMSTPTLTPTATETPIPPTPTSTPSPQATGAPPRFDFLTFARGITADKQPIEPATEFAAFSGPIYAFFSYSHMDNMMEWTYIWLKEDVELCRETELWQWGRTGRAHVFFGPPGGFEPGEYHFQLYLGDQLQLDAHFSVKP